MTITKSGSFGWSELLGRSGSLDWLGSLARSVSLFGHLFPAASRHRLTISFSHWHRGRWAAETPRLPRLASARPLTGIESADSSPTNDRIADRPKKPELVSQCAQLCLHIYAYSNRNERVVKSPRDLLEVVLYVVCYIGVVINRVFITKI